MRWASGPVEDTHGARSGRAHFGETEMECLRRGVGITVFPEQACVAFGWVIERERKGRKAVVWLEDMQVQYFRGGARARPDELSLTSIEALCP